MAKLRHVAPFFIVANLEKSMSFYIDKLGFEVWFKGPEDDPYFGIVARDNVSLMLKEITPDVLPVPNHTRHEWARWDAFFYTSDPDTFFAEYQSKGLSFIRVVADDDDGLHGFEIEDADGYLLFFGCPTNELHS